MNPESIGSTVLSLVIVFLSGVIVVGWITRRSRKNLPLAYASLFEQLRDGVLVLDGDDKIFELNPAGEQILGVSRDDLIGQNLGECSHPTLQYLYHARSGNTVQREIKIGEGEGLHWYEVRISPLQGREGNATGRIVVLHEITDRKLIEAELRYSSSHDQLTQVYNRMFFEEELDRLRVGRTWPVGVLVADLDNLKQTNDEKGHAAGDEMIRQAAKLMRDALRAGDMIARIGGDEFAVLLPGCDSEVVQRVINRIEAMLASYAAGTPTIPVSVSIGSSVAQDKFDLDEALQRADTEMYRLKNARKMKSISDG